MTPLRKRVANYADSFRVLSGAGVRTSSILLWPLRRRLPEPQNRIDLKSGVSIASPPDEPLVPIFKEIWIERRYANAMSHGVPSPTIVDIGAHVGVFALWAFNENREARLICVEPSPSNCEFLRKNLAVNGLQNARILQAACGEQQGERDLFRRGDQAMNTLYQRDNYGSKFVSLARVPTVTLQDVFQKFDVRVCHLLKMDCEGAEYEILYNLDEGTLRKVQAIAMEYHVGLNAHKPADLAEFLNDRGFRAHRGPLLDVEGGYLYAIRST